MAKIMTMIEKADLEIDECKLILANSLKRLKVVKEKISLSEEPPSVEELVDLLVEMSEVDVHLMELCASLIKMLVEVTGRLRHE
uniref:Uncharacterized protein n=2 Tax=viral metagenome TaxID=1070528 RepID=A0A6M3M9S8_9ZZZZ